MLRKQGGRDFVGRIHREVNDDAVGILGFDLRFVRCSEFGPEPRDVIVGGARPHDVATRRNSEERPVTNHAALP